MSMDTSIDMPYQQNHKHISNISKPCLNLNIINKILSLINNIINSNVSTEIETEESIINNKNDQLFNKILIFICKLYKLQEKNDDKMNFSYTLLYSIILIDNLCQKNYIQLNSFNIFQLLISSYLISYKVNSDLKISLQTISFISGMSIRDILIYESQFLLYLDYNIWVYPANFEFYLSYINILTESNESYLVL